MKLFSKHRGLSRAKAGFTLIELLVVIAIIGILASIIAVSLGTARAKGRDAKRISDIRTIQLALETYYNDNGTYPTGIYANQLASYLGTIPFDPKDNVSQYVYYAVGTPNAACGTAKVGYHLGALLEDSGNSGLKQDADANNLANSTAAGATICNGGTGGYTSITGGFDGKAGADATATHCAVGATVPGGTTELCYDVTN